ncbi:MAG: peptide chain release factor N(5)-glutamine methyltransferase [Clostridia bacterium]|nr:peptide chain release factor N(5)-glutamine methyltransferase [Clostridia bacterium]
MTLNEAYLLLKEHGVPDALYDARALFKKFGGASDIDLTNRAFSSDNAHLISAIERRAAREPLQYIIGEVSFYRETYKVTPDCLIPRSDTELLVDYAVKNLPRGAHFADLCCGSGCIGISVLKNTADTTATLVDISEGALKVTKENAERYGVLDRAKILLSDVTKNAVGDAFFAVLSNPPYVTRKAYAALEPEIYKEPEAAFVGGDDGADFYRAMTPIYKNIIENDGFIAYEIGYDQSDIIKDIANECGMSCEILNDLSDNPRVAVLRRM